MTCRSQSECFYLAKHRNATVKFVCGNLARVTRLFKSGPSAGFEPIHMDVLKPGKIGEVESNSFTIVSTLVNQPRTV